MTFGPHIPAGMSLEEYERLVYLDQLISMPLEMPPPVRKKPFLSDNEIKLLRYLINWCPNFLIFSQVHLLQLINVCKDDIDDAFMENYDYVFEGNKDKAYWEVFNMVRLLSVDFILSDKVGNPVYAIELDGKEHEDSPAVIRRDKIKSHVLQSIKIPLLVIRNDELASLTKLQQRVCSFAR